jgi:NAD(P)-dependent dehydrogenase (short-subunit alcohol dehydrogenase family)
MSKGIAWITGASSGIGRAIAVELAAAGWRVGVGARRENALVGLGEAAVGLDVCDRDSVGRWAAVLRGRLGDPDLVVNAAGWGIFETVQSTSDEDWDRTIATNLTGLFYVTRETLPSMLARGSGHFVNILSVGARVAFPKNAAYNASKYGALGFTEALRAEARRHGVRVTSVLPGATDTPFWNRVGGDWDRSKMMPPAAVARAVREAAEAGPESLVEEIRIAPPLGNL